MVNCQRHIIVPLDFHNVAFLGFSLAFPYHNSFMFMGLGEGPLQFLFQIPHIVHIMS